VFNAIVKVRQWWSNGHVAAVPVVPFTVACSCGRSVAGQRKLQPQVLPCPGCGRSLFIFPISPFAVDGTVAPPDVVAPAPTAQRPIWFWPVIAAGVTLALVAILFTILIRAFLTDSSDTSSPKQPTPEVIEQRWSQGRRALATGDFAQATRELTDARTALDQHADLLPAARKRLLLNQQREAELLADWASKGGKQPELLFGNLNNDPDLLRVYRQQVLVFDADLRRDPLGQYHIDYRRPKVAELVRLDLQNFKLIQKLPLMEPQRVIFAGRLAAARRAADGLWLVTLEPDSGVLLTDVEAANIAAGPPNEQRPETIQRQTKWVEDGP
jgi:hypothetical protein